MALEILLKAVEQDGKVDLWLSDNEGNIGINDLKSEGVRGEQVIWKVPNKGNIKRIVDIYKKPDSDTIFSTKPHAKGNKIWKAVVAEDVEGTEVYNIDFETEDGQLVSIDPSISLPPPTE